jgi:hypothetical protein
MGGFPIQPKKKDLLRVLRALRGESSDDAGLRTHIVLGMVLLGVLREFRGESVGSTALA